MRKQDKAIIWPAYFDSKRTRQTGRRVPKTIAVHSPKISEIISAVSKIGFQYEVNLEVSYPKKPWMKTGSLLVEKKDSKEQLISEIGKELFRIRSNSPKKRKK